MDPITHIIIIQFTQSELSKTYLHSASEGDLINSIKKLFQAYLEEKNILKNIKGEFITFIEGINDLIVLVYDFQTLDYEPKGKDYIYLICEEQL